MEKIHKNDHELEIGPKLYETYHTKNNGDIIMEKFVTDVEELLTKYILTDDQTILVESQIKLLFDKMLSDDKSLYVCFDIKFKNMLVNFTVSSNGITVDTIDKIVLTDFDQKFCIHKEKLSESESESNEKYIKLIKFLYFINLILAQIQINIKRIENYIMYQQFKKSNIKLLSLFMKEIIEINTFLMKTMIL